MAVQPVSAMSTSSTSSSSPIRGVTITPGGTSSQPTPRIQLSAARTTTEGGTISQQATPTTVVQSIESGAQAYKTAQQRMIVGSGSKTPSTVLEAISQASPKPAMIDQSKLVITPTDTREQVQQKVALQTGMKLGTDRQTGLPTLQGVPWVQKGTRAGIYLGNETWTGGVAENIRLGNLPKNTIIPRSYISPKQQQQMLAQQPITEQPTQITTQLPTTKYFGPTGQFGGTTIQFTPEYSGKTSTIPQGYATANLPTIPELYSPKPSYGTGTLTRGGMSAASTIESDFMNKPDIKSKLLEYGVVVPTTFALEGTKAILPAFGALATNPIKAVGESVLNPLPDLSTGTLSEKAGTIGKVVVPGLVLGEGIRLVGQSKIMPQYIPKEGTPINTPRAGTLVEKTIIDPKTGEPITTIQPETGWKTVEKTTKEQTGIGASTKPRVTEELAKAQATEIFGTKRTPTTKPFETIEPTGTTTKYLETTGKQEIGGKPTDITIKQYETGITTKEYNYQGTKYKITAQEGIPEIKIQKTNPKGKTIEFTRKADMTGFVLKGVGAETFASPTSFRKPIPNQIEMLRTGRQEINLYGESTYGPVTGQGMRDISIRQYSTGGEIIPEQVTSFVESTALPTGEVFSKEIGIEYREGKPIQTKIEIGRKTEIGKTISRQQSPIIVSKKVVLTPLESARFLEGVGKPVSAEIKSIRTTELYTKPAVTSRKITTTKGEYTYTFPEKTPKKTLASTAGQAYADVTQVFQIKGKRGQATLEFAPEETLRKTPKTELETIQQTKVRQPKIETPISSEIKVNAFIDITKTRFTPKYIPVYKPSTQYKTTPIYKIKTSPIVKTTPSLTQTPETKISTDIASKIITSPKTRTMPSEITTTKTTTTFPDFTMPGIPGPTTPLPILPTIGLGGQSGGQEFKRLFGTGISYRKLKTIF